MSDSVIGHTCPRQSQPFHFPKSTDRVEAFIPNCRFANVKSSKLRKIRNSSQPRITYPRARKVEFLEAFQLRKELEGRIIDPIRGTLDGRNSDPIAIVVGKGS